NGRCFGHDWNLDRFPSDRFIALILAFKNWFYRLKNYFSPHYYLVLSRLTNNAIIRSYDPMFFY
ncbi:MAG: hypothetical protein VW729_13795, partial [Deltaproteobacteria bacterium]